MENLKSFKTKIYFHRSKDENANIVRKALKHGFDSLTIDKLRYLGYEVELKVEIFENGTVKIINPENIIL